MSSQKEPVRNEFLDFVYICQGRPDFVGVILDLLI